MPRWLPRLFTSKKDTVAQAIVRAMLEQSEFEDAHDAPYNDDQRRVAVYQRACRILATKKVRVPKDLKDAIKEALDASNG